MVGGRNKQYSKPSFSKSAVEELSQDVGLMLISAVIDSECERIAGRKNVRNPLRTANWWGSQLSPVYYDRQKVLIDRPRLRGVDNKEIPLNTHKEGISKPQEDETGSMERA